MVNAIRLNPVKQLLRNRQTGLFLAEGGDWTPDESHAATFKSLVEVLQASKQHQIEASDVLLKFAGERYDVCLPLCSREADQACDS